MYSITRTWIKMLLSGAGLTARLAEMSAASLYVVAQRGQLFAFESNVSRKQRECIRMVLEKLQGSGECVIATRQALAKNYTTLAGSIASHLIPFTDSMASLTDASKKNARLGHGIRAACSFSALCISTPMNIGIFISTVSFQSMAPLHKRVLDNMGRLSL